MLTKKDYCDYDTCVALKEMGYNQYTSLRSYAGKGGVRLWDFDGEPNYKEGELIALSDMYDVPRDGNEVAAPSLYEAQKWLREEKGICVYPQYFGNTNEWIHTIYVKSQRRAIRNFHSTTYENSLLEGIKEAVKILKENGYGKDSNTCQ